MADFEVKWPLASSGGDGLATGARLNRAREIISTPWLHQLMLEGRMFVAGHGIEEAATDGYASLDDTTPSVALTVSGTSVVAIPVFFRAYFDTEGGAAPDWHLAYCQASKGVSGSGTAMDKLNCLGGNNPRTPSAEALHTCSGITAITDAQNVIFTQRIQVLDNYLSVEAATGKTGIEAPGGRYSNMEAVYDFKEFPLGLYDGSSVLFYANTGTTDTSYNYTIAWVELPADVYYQYTG